MQNPWRAGVLTIMILEFKQGLGMAAQVETQQKL
jgi:hypothetical protein